MLFHKIVPVCVFVLVFLPSFLFLFFPLPFPGCGSVKLCCGVSAGTIPGCRGVCSLLISAAAHNELPADSCDKRIRE
ncbi:hypothetical protein Nmel_014227, partial [Mimus melanotis]